MSAPYSSFPPGFAPYPEPVRLGAKRPVTGIISLVLGAVVFGGTLIAKLAAAAVTDTPEGVISSLGVAAFFSLLLIVPAVVLGHLAVAATAKGARVGRGMAVGALVLAYVDLVLFLVRLLAAAIATAVLGDPSAFFYNVFFWV
ncbi:hypothetical protein [Herbiconiux sp. UC225_62]|uniref:hypothetical protein n=1 Tax=Herbiconiux sp. UC225_62 TaxID=3350168 RepID=UPI0036D3F11C